MFTIPDTVEEIGGAFSGSFKLKEIIYFTSVDGVLFDKDMKRLISYPLAKRDTAYTVPDGVEEIPESAFSGCPLVSIDLPKGLKKRRAAGTAVQRGT